MFRQRARRRQFRAGRIDARVKTFLVGGFDERALSDLLRVGQRGQPYFAASPTGGKARQPIERWFDKPQAESLCDVLSKQRLAIIGNVAGS